MTGWNRKNAVGFRGRLVICCISVVPDKCLRVFVFAFQSLVEVEGIDQDESNNFVLLKASTAAACKGAQSSCRSVGINILLPSCMFALLGVVGAS